MNINHNLQYESSAPDFVKERNNKFTKAYKNLVITIDRIQGFLEDEYLRGRIESDMIKKKKLNQRFFNAPPHSTFYHSVVMTWVDTI